MLPKASFLPLILVWFCVHRVSGVRSAVASWVMSVFQSNPEARPDIDRSIPLVVAIFSVPFYWSIALATFLFSFIMSKLGRRLRAARVCSPIRRSEPLLLLEKLQRGLRKGVCLRQHRRAGLDEDVVFGVLRTFRGHVHIHDAAVGGGQVVFQCAELVAVI